VEGAFCELRPYGVLGSPPLNSSPILLAQAGRAAPQCLDAAPAPVHLVEQTILLSGQREVLLPAPIRLALASPPASASCRLHGLPRGTAVCPCAVRVSSKPHSPDCLEGSFSEVWPCRVSDDTRHAELTTITTGRRVSSLESSVQGERGRKEPRMLLEGKNAIIYGAGGAIGGAVFAPSPARGPGSSSPAAPSRRSTRWPPTSVPRAEWPRRRK
jgi:hypothetical protein